jgi:predicted phosphodiesterase
MARLVVMSDTHGQHRAIAVPEGDVLVHCGDFCTHGKEREAQAFARWFQSLPHRHKVVIAGNHDRCLELDPSLAAALFDDCTYLCDAAAEVAGLRFYGAPWQPWFLDWAFNLPRGEPLRRKWALIPPQTDVLLTHGPPMEVLDRTFAGVHAGCEELRAAVARLTPPLHVFGHIHEGFGVVRHGATLFGNASICDLAYDPTRAPLVFDLEPGGPARAVDGGASVE